MPSGFSIVMRSKEAATTGTVDTKVCRRIKI